MSIYGRWSDCADTLLDLICYEICRDSLSFEAEALLADHLAECSDCRRRLSEFKQTLRSESTSDSLAFWTTILR
jgi:hypothetical protein